MKDIQELVNAAAQTAQHAYAPYSNFKVGAALSASGQTFVGCNVENVAYPLGQCAEATAIGQMVASGYTSIDALVIQSPNEEFCYPCGGCRQKIAEFSSPETPVTMVNSKGESHTMTVSELLPKAFTF